MKMVESSLNINKINKMNPYKLLLNTIYND